MIRRHKAAVFRWLVLLSLVPAGCIVLYLLREEFSLQRLAACDAVMRQLYQDSPVLMTTAAFVVYVGATGASVPGAAAMAVACGWLFGFRTALILVSVASTSGASLAFLTSRVLLRRAVRERFAQPLKDIELILERDGAFYLFLLRLIPIIPFFVINIVMGLTPIRLRTFWWVSQLGMLPATILFVAAGATVPTLASLVDQGITGILTLKVMAVFTALGLLPLMARWMFVQRRAMRSL